MTASPPPSADAAAFAAHVNLYVTDYIKFADAKAAGILSVVAIVGATVGVASEQILSAARAVHAAVFLIGMLACGVVALAVLLTLWFCADALAPRADPAPGSLASFPDIAKRNASDYADAVSKLTPEAIALQYSHHNVVLSGIASKKFTALARASCFLRISLLAAYLATLIYGLSATMTSQPADGAPENSDAKPKS